MSEMIVTTYGNTFHNPGVQCVEVGISFLFDIVISSHMAFC
jgi:hypothetical protein